MVQHAVRGGEFKNDGWAGPSKHVDLRLARTGPAPDKASPAPRLAYCVFSTGAAQAARISERARSTWPASTQASAVPSITKSASPSRNRTLARPRMK